MMPIVHLETTVLRTLDGSLQDRSLDKMLTDSRLEVYLAVYSKEKDVKFNPALGIICRKARNVLGRTHRLPAKLILGRVQTLQADFMQVCSHAICEVVDVGVGRGEAEEM